jgi:beta-lactam-binding protein with PASTA domain
MSSAPAAGQAVGTPGSAACHTATDPDADPAKNTITVPDLLGMSKEKATAVLRAAGLDIAVGSVNRLPGGPCFPKEHANLIGPDGLLPPGVVGFTSPVSGTKVAPGTMIGVMITRE